jgi:hypothetical protein
LREKKERYNSGSITLDQGLTWIQSCEKGIGERWWEIEGNKRRYTTLDLEGYTMRNS